MTYFPVFLDLQDRVVAVVGNGPETESKVRQLLAAGAVVHLFAPELPGSLAGLAGKERFCWHSRPIDRAAVQKAWLVVSTCEDAEINEHVARLAEEEKVFCNVVDVTRLCSFIYPAIVARGEVRIAISTGGRSPALAQYIKKRVADIVGFEYGELNDILGQVRPEVVRRVPERSRRSRLFHRMVNGRFLSMIRRGKKSDVVKRIYQLLEQELATGQSTGGTGGGPAPGSTL